MRFLFYVYALVRVALPDSFLTFLILCELVQILFTPPHHHHRSLLNAHYDRYNAIYHVYTVTL